MGSHDLDDHQLARRLAYDAGRLLLRLRHEMAGQDIDVIRDIGDRRSHEYLIGELSRLRGDDAILSEEETPQQARRSRRLESERVWIIDPLDGTREYGEGLDDWAVHIALTTAGRVGPSAVSLPAYDEIFCTDPTSSGTSRRRLAADQTLAEDKIRVICSRSRSVPIVEKIADTLDAEIVRMGSAGAKAMAVVRGDVDIYVHTGGLSEWDSAAPVGVAQCHGFHVTRIDGSAFVYNQPDTYMPDLLLCRPELAETVLEIVREANI